MTIRCLSLVICFCFTCCRVEAREPVSRAVVVDTHRIWNEAPHNAFTDLIRFQDAWFCVFREGRSHVSPDGALRVLQSKDGRQWSSAALVSSATSDLRDAKISVTPENRLMLAGAEAFQENGRKQHQSLVWFSEDGVHWSSETKVADPNFWLWRITWHKGKAYGFGYGCSDAPRSLRFYGSSTGATFDTLIPKVEGLGTYPNETSILFTPDDTAYCLLRQDGQPKDGLIGKSKPPYTNWAWKSLGTRIGGPDMICLPDGRFVAVVRLYDSPVRTSVCWLDPEAGTLQEAVALPSGGDTSYAGLVWHDDLLWISYYSSHEGKTGIYLSRVRFE